MCLKDPERNLDVTIEADLGAITKVLTGCRGRLGPCRALTDGFEAADEARQRVRRRATRQLHLDQRKLPASLDSAIERGGELAARGNSFAHAADRGRDIGKVPIIEIVEARLRLEHPQCDVLAPAMFLRKRAHSQSPTTTPKRLEFGAKS